MGKLKKKIIPLFFLATVILYIIIYVVPRLTGIFDETYIAEYGELSVYDDTEGFVIRSERVYASALSGNVERMAKEGDLIRIGDAPASVSESAPVEPDEKQTALKERLNGDVTIIPGNWIEKGGIVSFYADGYENKITPESALDKDQSFFEKIDANNVIALPADNIYIEYPVFKIIDSSKWYIAAFVPKDSAARYEAGDTVYVDFDAVPSDDADAVKRRSLIDDCLEMTVYEASQSGGKIKIILETDKYYEHMGEYRRKNIRLISSQTKGIIIEADSVTEKDGVKGVYLVDKKGKYVFTPIRIIAYDGEKYAVADSYFYDKDGNRVNTLDPFDDVLRNPKNAESKVKE